MKGGPDNLNKLCMAVTKQSLASWPWSVFSKITNASKILFPHQEVVSHLDGFATYFALRQVKSQLQTFALRREKVLWSAVTGDVYKTTFRQAWRNRKMGMADNIVFLQYREFRF